MLTKRSKPFMFNVEPPEGTVRVSESTVSRLTSKEVFNG